MKIDGSLPIAKFAADLPGAMAVFEALGLDYLENCILFPRAAALAEQTEVEAARPGA